MSYMKTCSCGKEHWVVIHYKHNHSAFESPKGMAHPSKYSKVMCLNCGTVFTSCAKFVDNLPLYENKKCCFE